MLMTVETPVVTREADPIADLVCQSCGRVLAHVFDYQGKTAMHLIGLNGAPTHILRSQVECPQCGTVRSFFSVPMSAIRLGIAEG